MNPYGQPGPQPGYPPPGYGPPGHGPPGFGGPPKKGVSGAAIAMWVIIGLVVVAFGGCAVCMGFTRKAVKDAGEEFVEDAKKKGAERRKKKANPTDVKLGKLIDAYEDDAAKAKKKYEDEYVTVDGVITEIKPARVATRVVLVLSPKKGDDATVDCEALARKAENAREGDEVSVLARVAKSEKLELEDCEIQ